MFQKIAIFFLLFSIPFQARFFLYGDNTAWNSIFLYFTDLIIFFIFCLWLKNESYKNIKIKKYDWFLIGFLILSTLSSLYSNDLKFTTLKIIKLIEFIWLYFYFKNYSIKNLSAPIILSAIFQSFIAIAQFLYQHSLGLKILGEPLLSPYLFGIAKITTIDATLIRGYGTMPHPNVLAAFLLIAVAILLWNHFSENDDPAIKDLIYLSAFIILSLGIILTFSRTALFLWVLISVLFIISKFKSYPTKSIILTISIVIFSIAVLFLFSPELKARVKISPNEQAVSQRILYSNIALNIIKNNWLKGVGIGNYVNYVKNNFLNLQSWQYEPTHNIFLLIGAESGIFGILLFLIFLFKKFMAKILFDPLKISIISIILFFGFLDHFFWTLQSGNLMLWLLLGIF